MVRWVTPTRMPPIFSPALRQSLRFARQPGFRMVWSRCSKGSLASITWTLRTLAHAPGWLGTSSATGRPLCELVTPWLTTWRIFPPSAHLTFSKVPEPGRLQTRTWACSRSRHWAQQDPSPIVRGVRAEHVLQPRNQYAWHYARLGLHRSASGKPEPEHAFPNLWRQSHGHTAV